MHHGMREARAAVVEWSIQQHGAPGLLDPNALAVATTPTGAAMDQYSARRPRHRHV